jgi:hypothetical protein
MTTLNPNLDDLLAVLKQNARVAGFVLPYTLVRLHDYKLIDHKSGLLLKDAEGLWKVRMLTTEVDFDASCSKGSGRTHTAQSWESGTDEIAGFIVIDHRAVSTPELPFWKVRVATVEKWRNGASSTSFTRNEALAKLRAL